MEGLARVINENFDLVFKEIENTKEQLEELKRKIAEIECKSK